jgi:hypothetical protein
MNSVKLTYRISGLELIYVKDDLIKYDQNGQSGY